MKERKTSAEQKAKMVKSLTRSNCTGIKMLLDQIKRWRKVVNKITLELTLSKVERDFPFAQLNGFDVSM